MNIVQQNSYPVYEADQVLTSDHLNQAFAYLEEQERLTRAKLIGSGIVCGLQADVVTQSGVSVVRIRKGVGLTSQGFLIAMAGNEPTPDEVIYPYFTPYTDPNEDTYRFFLNGEQHIELFELQTELVEDAETLANLENPLSSYGVLLYLECFDKQLKNCIENDCNEKGTERIFTLRKLLVSKADLRNIICAEQSLNVPKSESQIAQIVNGRYGLMQIPLQRLVLGNSKITSAGQLIGQYQSLISSSLTTVSAGLLRTYQQLHPLLIRLDPAVAEFPDLVNLNLKDLSQRVLDSNYCDLQYFHDFLCDLAETHNELIDAAFDLMSECCPDLDRYPKHLRLGDLQPNADCPPSVYRTRFLQAPIHNFQHRLKAEVHTLMLKMSLMIKQYQLTEGLSTIRITPSRALPEPLSRRSIPFYYDINDQLLRNWNAELKRKCRERENLSYFYQQYFPYQQLALSNNPLLQNLHPYDFFLIEGHHCQHFQTALSNILSLRTQFNLPFDVIALKLSRDSSNTAFDELHCNFQDLEMLCAAWKNEMQCLLSKVLNELTAPNAKDLLKASAAGAESNETNPIAGFGEGRWENFTEGVSRMTYDTYYSTPVFDEIIKSVDTTSGSMGSYLSLGLQMENSPCNYYIHALEGINAIEGINELEQADYEVAYYLPMQVATAILDYGSSLDRSCHDLDLEALQEKLDKLNQQAAKYLRSLSSYRNRENSMVNINYEAMFRIMTLLVGNCSMKKLETLFAEMERRKEKIMRLNLFHEYVQANPGIDHRGGVPKGGTFILVYAGDGDSPASDGPVATQPYQVQGRIVDDSGAPIIGANIFVQGTTIATTTNIDGSFSLVVPAGIQVLRVTYIGYKSKEIEVRRAGDFTIRLNTGDTDESDRPAPGIVVADFFLPYLCCSDCPPVAYILPEDPDKEVVNLNIAQKSYCLPDDREYAFVVEPADGKVTGNGVVGDVENGFFFAPDKVTLAEEAISAQLQFKVNEQEVPLVVSVHKTPEVEFSFEIFWADSADNQTAPFIKLANLTFDERIAYTLTVNGIDPTSGNRFPIIKAEPVNTEETTLALRNGKGGMNVEVTLKAANGGCENSNTENSTIPHQQTPVDINFNVLRESQPVDPPYVFENTDESRITIIASPVGEFVQDAPAIRLELKAVGTTDEGDASVYQFTAIQKPAGDYPLTYKAEGQSAQLLITIRGEKEVAVDIGSTAAKLKALAERPRFNDLIGKRSTAYKNTQQVVADLTEQLSKRESAEALRAGEYNKAFVRHMEPATEETVAKTIKGNTNENENTPDQNFLLEFYHLQLGLPLDMIVLQAEDINQQHILSKFVTTLNNQVKELIKKAVHPDPDGTLEKRILASMDKMEDKPNAVKKVKQLLKTVKK